MTAAPDRPADVAHLQQTLQAAYRNRVHNLRVSAHEDGVELGGEATTYHAVQLVIRDVLVAGVRILRNRIRVRPARA